MTSTAYFYGHSVVQAFLGNIKFTDGNVKVALCTADYAPDQDAHTFFSDITNEVSSTGTGYTAGGKVITSPNITYDTNNIAIFDCDDVIWTTSTIEARYAIIYYYTGDNTTSPLLAYYDFGANQNSSAADFQLRFNANGILRITISGPTIN